MRTYITIFLIAIIFIVLVFEANYSCIRSSATQESPLETSQESRQFNHVHRCSINAALAQLKQGDTYKFRFYDSMYRAFLRLPSICIIHLRTTLPGFLQPSVLRI